ncbi:MAG: hypothetical protein WCJ41_18330 [Aestuariivirga sp.]|uniref:hypothetical protein n=1 Tax=Aestuariivirga sp. TaxID=2650926 RepID=UPI00301639D8
MDGKRGGRSPGTRNRRTEALMALAEEGETPCGFALRLMRDDTQDPDVRMHAAKIAAPYVHPKPQPEPRIVSFDLPGKIDGAEGLLSVHDALLRATAIGDIALEDAKDISAMLETHRRLVETTDLEQRLVRLEAEQAKGTAQ